MACGTSAVQRLRLIKWPAKIVINYTVPSACGSKKCNSNLIKFTFNDQAFDASYELCRVCNP